MAFAKFRDGMVGPTVILLAICAAVALALAQVYTVTAPVIEEVNRQRADAARTQVLPGAGEEGFRLLSLDLPAGVEEVYAANNGTGYVVRCYSNGYGGRVTYMIGVDSGGKIAGISMFDHSETPGLGSKVGKASYLEQYLGDTDPYSVDSVASATRTSNTLRTCLELARETYRLAVEGADAGGAETDGDSGATPEQEGEAA